GATRLQQLSPRHFPVVPADVLRADAPWPKTTAQAWESRAPRLRSRPSIGMYESAPGCPVDPFGPGPTNPARQILHNLWSAHTRSPPGQVAAHLPPRQTP